MNARGIPAQSEPGNLEKEYSYTVNEMTGEKTPFGEKPKQASSTTSSNTEQQPAQDEQPRQRRAEKKPE